MRLLSIAAICSHGLVNFGKDKVFEERIERSKVKESCLVPTVDSEVKLLIQQTLALSTRLSMFGERIYF